MQPRAAVIGSGPNGLAAAIRMAQAGFEVEVFEGAARAGGGASSGELTLPGFVHDLGSAIHPMAVASPFFRSLHLEEHGLRWIQPEIPLAHPLDDGTAVTLRRDLNETVADLGPDGAAYRDLVEPAVRHWSTLMGETLKPLLAVPGHPFLMAQFGLRAFQPAAILADAIFRTERAKALFAGSSAHSFLQLERWMSASFGMILSASAHAVGWPIPAGGAQSITDALLSVLRNHGGIIHLSTSISSLEELPDRQTILCDVTPRQFLHLAHGGMQPWFQRALERYRYGPGIYKLDWALSDPIPWRAPECRRAGTVHVGGTMPEIAASERAMFGPEPSGKPFIIVAQSSVFDSTRAPDGQHTAWGYCHVPNAWNGNHTDAIESQIERFAPGFRDCVLARHVSTPADLQRWNPNLVGGDINGGLANLTQFVLRPTLLNYRTSIPGVYLCSSSTPPGGGVHGMCGYNAAQVALRKWRIASA